ncbi:MAG: hypothetical protein ACRERS_02010, partial [Methylococcales bacterium]
MSEVLQYLDKVAKNAAKLPNYFPKHLRGQEPGEGLPFDTVRQQLQVIEDRARLDLSQARINEQLSTQTGGDPHKIYSPLYQELMEEPEEQKPSTFTWNDKALFRYPRMVILGDPGYGKSWLLSYEARRWAVDQARKLRERRIVLQELVLPIHLRLEQLSKHHTI